MVAMISKAETDQKQDASIVTYLLPFGSNSRASGLLTTDLAPPLQDGTTPPPMDLSAAWTVGKTTIIFRVKVL
jgi:hypothetical protein